jgi:hypothetical protein
MKLYYEAFKKEKLDMWSRQLDVRLAQDGIIHLTSAGLWNYRAILESQFGLDRYGGVKNRVGWTSWGYDINAFFDNTNVIPPFMRESFKSYLEMTKLPDMKGVAVQGLYLSSWINSYTLALAIHSYLRRRGALRCVFVVIYVDNIQVFAPSLAVDFIATTLEEAVASIGCSMKLDAGFCS